MFYCTTCQSQLQLPQADDQGTAQCQICQKGYTQCYYVTKAYFAGALSNQSIKKLFDYYDQPLLNTLAALRHKTLTCCPACSAAFTIQTSQLPHRPAVLCDMCGAGGFHHSIDVKTFTLTPTQFEHILRNRTYDEISHNLLLRWQKKLMQEAYERSLKHPQERFFE